MIPGGPVYSELLPGLYCIEDSCKVYVVTHGDHAIAVDFGSGDWLGRLAALGLRHLDHIFLTHHHADQCSGLCGRTGVPTVESMGNPVIHAPVGEDRFLAPEKAQDSYDKSHYRGRGCPESYSVPTDGIPGLHYDMAPASGDIHWCGRRIRFVHTPGHTRSACSVLVDHQGKQVLFCGDAVHAGGTVWEPFHLEWDHWTGEGALAAWQGIEVLRGLACDLICPSHGPVIRRGIGRCLNKLSRRLMAFYRAKGNISPGEPDRYLHLDAADAGEAPGPAGSQPFRQVLPGLYLFGTNGYLIRSVSGEALLIDPQIGDMDALGKLLVALPGVAPTAATATHYHLDHCSALPELKRDRGVQILLHPAVALPLGDVESIDAPWLPEESIVPDGLLPTEGGWAFREFTFHIAPAPGQTWWHCMLMAEIAGKNVLFSGDSFQPNSRWNGTGGFCAYNRSRFTSGFVATAGRISRLHPDLIAAGHGTVFGFSVSRFRKIRRWATRTRRALTGLCPHHDLHRDYYRWPTA